MAQATQPPHGSAHTYARVVVALQLLIIAAWVAASIAAHIFVLPLQTGSSLNGLLSGASGAVRTEKSSIAHFDSPLLAQTLVVQHREGGLAPTAEADAFQAALDFNTSPPRPLEGIAAAVPITNVQGVVPGSTQTATTILTYLLFPPTVSPADQLVLANRYAQHYLGDPHDGFVGVTGALVDEETQGSIIKGALIRIEIACIVLIIVIVGLAFRSVAAPIITLLTAGIAFIVSRAVLELCVQYLGIRVPAELGPILVALLLGIATDYTVFFLAGYRDDLRDDEHRPVVSIAAVAPLVAVAGITVAAGVGSAAIARLVLFRDLAPALAITVIVTMLVAVTFVPAVLALVKRRAYWPSQPAPPIYNPDPFSVHQDLRSRVTRVVVRPPIAAAVVVLCLAALIVPAAHARDATVALNLATDLPSDSRPVQAARAASQGFVPGILSPTVVLLKGDGVGRQHASLAALGSAIDRQPGVARTLGPGLNPTAFPLGVFISKDQLYARFLVIFVAKPYGPTAIANLRQLEQSMPTLLRQSGLANATAAYTGGTAASSELAHEATADLLSVGGLALVVNLLILILFLRSLVVPVILVAASALVLAAALGITSWTFHAGLDTPGFTFFVPVAVEVLLISFGADYNLFLVGRVWEMAAARGEKGLRHVISDAAAEASAPINNAGITLAGCFATIVFVDVNSFREFAFAMVCGLLIDTFVVRLFLVPALLALLGERAGWPGHRLRAPVIGARGKIRPSNTPPQ
ncbi:MAG TPA: MMPL family transporter [Caulobacteraceae bacterium]|nr:MMPL family transporter [Caulobacteraceae bacterium]